MIICAVLLILSTAGGGEGILPVVVDAINPNGITSIEIDTIPQVYFEDLVFLEIDTGKTYVDTDGSISVHTLTGYKTFRIAVDAEERVYKLFGFDTLEFNQLIFRYPAIEVDLGNILNIYDYGRFFAEMIMIPSSSGDYYFVEGAHAFVEFNRKWMLDDYTRFVPQKLQDLENRMVELGPVLSFDVIRFDRRTHSYIADYYVWFASNGNLRHISLRMEDDGACDVVADEILAERLGAYDSTRKALFPPSED